MFAPGAVEKNARINGKKTISAPHPMVYPPAFEEPEPLLGVRLAIGSSYFGSSGISSDTFLTFRHACPHGIGERIILRPWFVYEIRSLNVNVERVKGEM